MSNGINFEALQAEASRLTSSSSENQGGGFLDNFVKLPDGEGVVAMRILPPAPLNKYNHDEPLLFQPTKLSYLNGKGIHCNVSLEKGKWVGDCPIDGYYKHLWSKTRTDPDNKETYIREAGKIKPIERYYYNVIVRGKESEGVKIYSCGKTVHQQILKAFVGDAVTKMKPLGDITDFEKGRDFILVKKIKRSDGREFPNYAESRFDEPSQTGTVEECAAYVEGLHDLRSLKVDRPIDELKTELKKHLGLIPNSTEASATWNPSEFQSPVSQTSTQTGTVDNASEMNSMPQVQSSVAETSPSPGMSGTVQSSITENASEVVEKAASQDEALPEEDFMAKLNSLVQNNGG